MAGQPESMVAISSTFTAEPVSEFLQFWLERLHLALPIKHAPFNQIFQTLLDPAGLFARNQQGVNVILLRWQDLGEDDAQIERNAISLIETITRSAGEMGIPLVVASCPCSPTFLSRPTAARLEEQLNARLLQCVGSTPNVNLLPVATLQSLYSVAEVHDVVGEHLGQIPYTGEFFAALGTMLARRIAALRRVPYKVIAVDLDNTLWAGVVGEEGPEGVRIGPEHLKLQEFLLSQRSDGMLLTICSKNNETDAWAVFEQRPEMLLNREHFAAWRINWEPKSTNLRAMANELRLGLDSFIFIDDDAKECSEVEANIPAVLTLRLPAKSEDIPTFLQHVWVFDRANVTAEDRKRNESYRLEKARAAAVENATSLQDFIASLALQVDIEPLRPELLPRVAQLTKRTNQFNTTTIRRTEADIRGLIDVGKMKCITVAVKDRFGDYGNVGAALYTFDASSLVVDSLLLSCRALGRGVEHQMVRYLGEEAERHQVSDIVIRFIASPRNAPALRFLDSLEAKEESGGEFTVAFRMRAESASRLVYKPISYDDVVRNEESSPKPAAAQPRVDYAAIATRLNTAAAVRQEMRKFKLGLKPATRAAGSVAPRNQTEADLAAIWADVLQLPEVGIHDDFFELGGDSLRAVELLIRINEKFTLPDLTLSAVLDAPTVEQFAATLGEQKRVRCLVPLRASGTRPPIFCVPGAGGNVLSFRDLALNLPGSQPFWALQAPGLDGSGTVDDAKHIAALYLEEIRTIQPHGPYFLGGGSYGGVIAFEMAQQLISKGEDVALLAMFDTYNLAYGKMIPRAKAIFLPCKILFSASRRISGKAVQNAIEGLAAIFSPRGPQLDKNRQEDPAHAGVGAAEPESTSTRRPAAGPKCGSQWKRSDRSAGAGPGVKYAGDRTLRPGALSRPNHTFPCHQQDGGAVSGRVSWLETGGSRWR